MNDVMRLEFREIERKIGRRNVPEIQVFGRIGVPEYRILVGTIHLDDFVFEPLAFTRFTLAEMAEITKRMETENANAS